MNEKAKTYQAEFDKENAVQVKMKLYKNTDADILEHLARQENKQGYLKALIRQDMERN